MRRRPDRNRGPWPRAQADRSGPVTAHGEPGVHPASLDPQRRDPAAGCSVHCRLPSASSQLAQTWGGSSRRRPGLPGRRCSLPGPAVGFAGFEAFAAARRSGKELAPRPDGPSWPGPPAPSRAVERGQSPDEEFPLARAASCGRCPAPAREPGIVSRLSSASRACRTRRGLLGDFGESPASIDRDAARPGRPTAFRQPARRLGRFQPPLNPIGLLPPFPVS